MAFATSNVRRNPSGSHMTLTGSWTGSEGDASGTFTIKGAGRMLLADFWDSSGSSPDQARRLVSSSVSGRIITLTIHNHKTVTEGRFRIEYL